MVQVEIISALIGAAVALPASGVAYAVGRHQAAATISAAHTQAAAGHKQWRDNNRREAWLLFVRSADELSSMAAEFTRGESPRGSEVESAIEGLESALSNVEFEGPAEVFCMARKMNQVLIERLIFSAFIKPYVSAQRKFDRALAEAQRESALVSPGGVSEQSSRVLEANQSLESLPSASAAARSSVAVPDDAMATAMMISAPFVESAGREHRESLSLIAQGIARIVVSASIEMPEEMSAAHVKLQACEELDEGDVAALIVNRVARFMPAFEQILSGLSDAFQEERKKFILETDKHLDARLPVPR
ncbi:hypothetical protein [Streptomyces achromogenes]|uniref:hypothetical protein n=1 Tax=Streptomyces achromogenes TaxID=67255 RepID=UPI0036C07745